MHKDSIRDWNVFIVYWGEMRGKERDREKENTAKLSIYYYAPANMNVMCHKHTATFQYICSVLVHVLIQFPRFPSLLFHYLSKAIAMNEVFIISYLLSIYALFTVRWTSLSYSTGSRLHTQRHFELIEQSTLHFLERPNERTHIKKWVPFWRIKRKEKKNQQQQHRK